MKINWTKLKPHLPIIAIITLAAVLRSVALIHYGDFWDDEIFNFIYSQKTWPQGLIYWLWETNPPLHLLILKLWFYLVPATEFFARLPSVLAGMVTVWITYRLGKELFNKNTGLLAAFYLAIHPYHIFWSATARVYVFLILLTTLSTLFFYRRFFQANTDTTKTPAHWTSPLVNFFLIFSHLSSLLFFAGQFILLVTLKGKKELGEWIKENAIPFFLGGLWITSSFWIKTGNDLSHAWFFLMKNDIYGYFNPIINLLVGQLALTYALPIIAAIILLWGITFYREAKSKNNQILILTILVLIPMLIAAAFGVWQVKFFLAILPLLLIIICRSIENIASKFKAIILIIPIICIVGLSNLWRTLPLSNWNFIKNYLAATPPKTILIYNNYILKTQIDRYLPTHSKNTIPLILYSGMSWDDMVVKKNYIFKIIDSTEKDDWYQKNMLDSYYSLVLLQGEYDYMNELNSVLIKHGWNLKKGPNNANIFGRYQLYQYEKN